MSISPRIGDSIGLKSQMNNGFITADIEHSSLILCGKAFADLNNVKYALSALAAPVVFARGGIPVYGRILSSGDCPILLFAPEKTIQICSELHKNLTCNDAGVVLSSYGSAPFFHTGDSDLKFQMTTPSSVVFASSDCTGVLPLLTKISPDQAAYHFLAGYQDGKFVTTYCKDPSPIPPLELANALLSYLKQNHLPSFLVNVSDCGKHVEAKKFLKTLESTLSDSVPELSFGLSCDPKVGDLKQKYKKFLSGKYQYMPKEFSF
ncbi:Phosphoenolpyruvate carboxykinase (ATP) [Zostera marina]|uniref:Phosphoenolpyruvate carboxykinase (ATP) n=1 Tax=Zostera marina TaxID=29655 RepID=A0A0K9PBX8_ZOSMR|nr:Phosphoenolpyruvate carboxykinase (ATP) [Zostera marina]